MKNFFGIVLGVTFALLPLGPAWTQSRPPEGIKPVCAFGGGRLTADFPQDAVLPQQFTVVFDVFDRSGSKLLTEMVPAHKDAGGILRVDASPLDAEGHFKGVAKIRCFIVDQLGNEQTVAHRCQEPVVVDSGERLDMIEAEQNNHELIVRLLTAHVSLGSTLVGRFDHDFVFARDPSVGLVKRFSLSGLDPQVLDIRIPVGPNTREIQLGVNDETTPLVSLCLMPHRT